MSILRWVICLMMLPLLGRQLPCGAAELRVLFLGDNGHHLPRARFEQLQPVLRSRGIQLEYTDVVQDLNPERLAEFDGVLLYANIDRIDPREEQALLDFVQQGGGFLPLHCASYCFRNSDAVVALMGAQFQRHGVGVFRTEIVAPDHPILKGFAGFESWDETYVHHKHNEANRTVLAYRVDDSGREPWTWVRTQGKGRVFYTAWGHDQRTWGHPGFQNLVERGIRWACGDDPARVPAYLADRPFPVPEMQKARADVRPFEYLDVGNKIPFYPPSRTWGVQGEAQTKMQKPVAPAESMKHIVVPQGFRVELFASEPHLGGKPICMAWDERGRLWVAETYDYPNELQPPGQGRDRIRIVEDTDGDWRADRFTVFAEDLSIPTSITFHRGGVIVQDGTRTLYLRDLDGDDVAEERTVLFEGWNQRDTHGGVSNFQYGLDNWIWAMQGYNNSQPQKSDGTASQSFRQGFFRFRPDGSQIEFIRSTNNNTWGLGISEEGVVFGSTANRNPSVYMPIPNRYYERVRGWTPSLQLGTIADTHLFKPITDKVRQVDQHGGYTAGAGHALYTAREYPPEYWNRVAFVNGPTGHLVGSFVLEPQGSDFRSSSPFNLFASDDEWTAPIMSEIGPDGHVWVLDWYNFIVQHNPTPQGFQTGKGNAYETDLRDKKYGRIYRVVYEGEGEAKTPPRPFSLLNATPETLVATLAHPTMMWRKHAQRLLVERGKTDVVPALIQMVEDPKTDAIGLNVGAMHALWTLHGLGQLDGDDGPATSAAVAALRHASAGVRRNALQVLPPTTESTLAVLNSGRLQDDHPQVRLAALLALADLPTVPEAGPAILAAATAPTDRTDRWIQDAAVCAAATNAEGVLAALSASKSELPARTAETMRIVAAHYGRQGNRESIGRIIRELTNARPDVANSILTGLVAGWPSDQAPAMSASLENDLKSLLDRLPTEGRGALVKLARQWGSQQFEDYVDKVSQAFLNDLDDRKLPIQSRIEAARQLVAFRAQDEDIVSDLLERIGPQSEPEISVAIIDALRESETSAVGRLLVRQFSRLTPRNRSAGIRLLLARPESTTALLGAIDSGTIPISELTLDQRQSLLAHPSEPLRRRARGMLNRGGAIPNADRQKVLAQLMPITQKQGNSGHGKEVFKKKCANCHMHSGEGQKIGPDLTGMAVHPKAELLGHILDPSRDVEGNYRVYSVMTIDGRVLNGLLAAESKTAIELYDAEGKKQVILREDVDELKASIKSLMPEGFEKEVSAQEMTDLLEFLTARGKFLPVNLGKVATVASDRGMFQRREAQVERLIFSDWSPKTFKGVPFHLTDPEGGKVNNTVLLQGPLGTLTKNLPKSVVLPCNGPVRAVHLLSGVSGWGYPYSQEKSVSLIVRLKYEDGEVEDHELRNALHFADYIRHVDVPESELAFKLRNQQIRYLAVHPNRSEPIREIELVKGPDQSAPVVMAVTLESPSN